MEEEYSYQAKGTMQTCPYSNEPAIVVSDGADISKSQCRYSDEWKIAGGVGKMEETEKKSLSKEVYEHFGLDLQQMLEQRQPYPSVSTGTGT